MNQSFDISTIILAALAVFIVWKLRSVLGTRTGQERPPFNPFLRRRQANAPGEAGAEMGKVIPLPGAAPVPARAVASDPDRWKGVAEPGSTVAAGLDQIAAADPSFSGKAFLEGAKAAYELIISAFAKGDSGALQPLLARDVYDGFATAIADREKRGETIRNTLVAMNRAVVEDAGLRSGTAHVTVEFESQQVNQTLAKDGTPAPGSSDGVEQVVDRWTFARDVASADPNWRLVATNAE
jgi:predicted lipid-binding transport protein (Tim44 family)